MKYILTMILAVFVVGSVSAQQYSTTTHTLTNTVAAVTTNQTANTAAITLTKYEDVTITVSCALTAAGTTTSDFKFSRSLDGTTYETTPSTTVTLANAGTGTVTGIANVDVGAAGYLRLATMTNGDDDGVLTNVVIKYTTKPARFGK